MSQKNQWLQISDEIRRIHPVIRSKVDSLQENMDKAEEAAKTCKSEGVSLAIDACKLAVTLDNNLENLALVGIISKEESLKLCQGLQVHCVNEFYRMYRQFATCFDTGTRTEILDRVLNQASKLEPESQQLLVKFSHLLVKFALDIREMERRAEP